MGSELLRRVRWSNVARACVAVVVVAAIVLWPRLGSPAPRVPDPVARPLGVAPVVTAPAPVKRPKARRVRRRHRPSTVPARRANRRSVEGGGANPGIEGGGVGGSVGGGGTDPRLEGGGGTNPGIEGGGVGGSVEGGGTDLRLGGGGGTNPDIEGGGVGGSVRAGARDPAETEFGFEQ
jgi:hypothetical protein